MPRFQVRFVSAENRTVCEEEFDAPDIGRVRAVVEGRGGVVLAVRETNSTAAKLGRDDLSWWCRELKTLIGAGMTVVEALETLQAQSSAEDAARLRVQRGLMLGIQRGLVLSEAMYQVHAFPPVLIASVRSAERTSALAEALDDFLRYHDMLEKLRRRVVSAAIYPALVVAIGALICTFLLVVVMPRFMSILEGSQALVSGGTGLLMQLSQLLVGYGIWLLFALLGLVIGLKRLVSGGHLRAVSGPLLRHVRPLRLAVQTFQHAKLYHALALLCRGGYAFEEALGVCADGEDVADGKRQALQDARAALFRGQGVAQALTDAGLTDEVSRRLLRVGERSGGFDAILQIVAERHAQSFALWVDRCMRLVEPLLLLLVALVVGGVVVLMYLPIFEIATSLQA